MEPTGESKLTVHDIFKVRGVPTVTYVQRSAGSDQKKLHQGLDRRGNICLVTGASKTGKTTLYTSVLQDRDASAVKVRGGQETKPADIWSQALEQLSFARTASTETGTERGISAELKASAAPLLPLDMSLGGKSDRSATTTKAHTLAAPSAPHLVPFLADLRRVLVLEDFHYFSQETRNGVFQDAKVFSDSEISIIVVGTTHRSGDLAEANPDLAGRLTHVWLDSWSTDDLCEISRQGFRKCKVGISREIIELIGLESFGLPIITQAACLQLMLSRGIEEPREKWEDAQVRDADVFDVFMQVARSDYHASYAQLLQTLQHDSHHGCALLTSLFLLPPPTFTLNSAALHERLERLPGTYTRGLSAPEIARILPQLDALQADLNMPVLDWDGRRQALFMIQPAFLFYLRWKDGASEKRFRVESVESLLRRR